MEIPSSLLQAYLQTDYIVFEPELKIIIGQKNENLDRLLAAYKVTVWAFITAWNPKSECLAPQENKEHQRKLLLKTSNYPQFLGEGRSRTGEWEAENSVLLLGISKYKAIRVGQSFGQNAIVFGKYGKEAELIILDSPYSVE